MDEEKLKKYKHWINYLTSVELDKRTKANEYATVLLSLKDFIIKDEINKDKNLFELVFLDLENHKKISESVFIELHPAMRKKFDNINSNRITAFIKNSLPMHYNKAGEDYYESKSL